MTPGKRIKKYGALTWEESDEEPEEQQKERTSEEQVEQLRDSQAELATSAEHDENQREGQNVEQNCDLQEHSEHQRDLRAERLNWKPKSSHRFHQDYNLSSDDPRKDYLAKVIMDHLVGGSDARTKLAKGADKTYADLCNSGHMETFLEQSAGDTPLQASLMHSGGQLEIKLFTEVKLGDAEAFVCFTKVGSAPISAENTHNDGRPQRRCFC